MGIRAHRRFLCSVGKVGCKGPHLSLPPVHVCTPQVLICSHKPRVLCSCHFAEETGKEKRRIAVINEFIFSEYHCSAPLHIPSLLPSPLCIIHHIGLLPCFPGLFLPSMPVTLTESPQSPAAPNSKPPSIWITDYIPLFSTLPLVSTEPYLRFFSFLVFASLHHFITAPLFSGTLFLSSFLCFSIIHISVPSSPGGPTLRTTSEHTAGHGVGGGTARLTCVAAYSRPCLPQTVKLNSSRVDMELGSSPDGLAHLKDARPATA